MKGAAWNGRVGSAESSVLQELVQSGGMHSGWRLTSKARSVRYETFWRGGGVSMFG